MSWTGYDVFAEPLEMPWLHSDEAFEKAMGYAPNEAARDAYLAAKARDVPMAEPPTKTQVPEPDGQPTTNNLQGGTEEGVETHTVEFSASVGGATEQQADSKSFSARFAQLEKEALRYGATPVELDLPDDLPATQRALAEDISYVAGIYRAHGEKKFPYSARWREQAHGLSRQTVCNHLKELRARGIIAYEGATEEHRHYPRATSLWVICALKQRPVPVEPVAVEPAEELVEEPRCSAQRNRSGLGRACSQGCCSTSRPGRARQAGRHRV
jgi:DNA-binding Lrp family transcriptional regulator